MDITEKNGNLIIRGIKDFHLGQTLECGQCFHFRKLKENEYAISAKKRLLHISWNEEETVMYDTDRQDFFDIWYDYFDFGCDYSQIKRTLLSKDAILSDAIESMWGVRILKQDFFETLISFIISQNKQIPHIKQLVFAISEKYGRPLGLINGEMFYSFPDASELINVSIDEWKEMKVGFRAPYIYDAVHKVYDRTIDESKLRKLSCEECLDKLMVIKGVGEKVASCVALFGLSKTEAFPVDVWIKRIMEELYFHKNTDKEVIRRKALSMFGEYGGYAQQYLFYYGKVNNIGK